MSSVSCKFTTSAPSGELFPYTPKRSARYDDKVLRNECPQSVRVQAGSSRYSGIPVEQYLPEYWSRHIQPEGQAYFFFSQEGAVKTVTEEHLYDEQVLEHVNFWRLHASDLIRKKGFELTANTELCLELDGQDCFYYFVDYATRTMFWLENYDSEDLGLEMVVSPSHLDLTLTEQFWRHIEFFPMHFGGLPIATIDECICIMNHGWTDKITSTVATSLYTEGQCEKLLKTLEVAKKYPTDGHQTCVVARIWAHITTQRIVTQYGERHPRLSLDQRIIHSAPKRTSIVTPALARLSFYSSDAMTLKLDTLFVDRLVYTEQWKSFLAREIQTWRENMYLALFGLVLHVVLLGSPESVALGAVSFGLFGASTVTSFALVRRYSSMDDLNVTLIWEHIASLETKKYGLQWAGFVLSLPSTFLIWGTLVYFSNGIYMLWQLFGHTIAISVFALATFAFLSFHSTLSGTSLCAFLPTFRTRPSSNDPMELV